MREFVVNKCLCNKNMEQLVADYDENEITSSLELSQMREEEQRLALQVTRERISDVISDFGVRCMAFHREKERLEQLRESETNNMLVLKEMVASEQQILVEEAEQIRDLKVQIGLVHMKTLFWLKKLPAVQEANAKALDQDPIYQLMLEEQALKDQLESLTGEEEKGKCVCNTICIDDYCF